MPKNSSRTTPYSKKVRRITKRRIYPDWYKDLDVLRSIICNCETVNSPGTSSFSDKDYPIPHFQIATVSTNIAIEDLTVSKRQGYEVYYVANARKRKHLQNEYIAYLKTAAEQGATLVCFNELAYPKGIDRAEDEAFQKRIKHIVKKYGVFVIGGSYHDTRKYYNLCPVFSPYPTREVTPTPQQERRSRNPEVYPHAKLTSAVKLSESIRIPSNRDLRYYETEYGSFSILICLDAYDPALAFRLMRTNHPASKDKKIEIVFVPAFSPEKSPSMAKACRDLSYATASLVVYANCAANDPRHAVYLAGQPLPVRRTSAPNSSYRSRKISQNVMLHEVTYDSYHKLRINVTDRYSPIFEYLIGQKAGLRHNVNLSR